MRTPSDAASSLIDRRNASSSVTSASSWLVTWGTFTQARCRCGPEMRLIRESGRVSISPNLEKSTAGMGGMPLPPAAAGASAGAGAERARFTKPLTSSTQHPALASGPRDLGEIDAELARVAPHRRRGVGDRSRLRFGRERRGRRRPAARRTRVRRRGAVRGFGRPPPPRLAARRAAPERRPPWIRPIRRSGSARPSDTRSPHRESDAGDPSGHRGGHVHRRLVTLQGDKGVLGTDTVSGADQHFDDRDVGEVADVGNPDFDDFR